MSVARYARVVGWTLVHRYPWSPSDFDVAGYGFTDLSALGDIDGLIASCHNPEAERTVRKIGVPTVNISSVRVDPIVPSVCTDNPAIGRLAARHLLDRGLRHFAFLHTTPTAIFDTRLKAFASELRGAGHAPHVLKVPAGDMGPERRERIANWLRTLPLPVGLAALHDVTAMDVQRICRDLPLGIPEQIALLGSDDDPLIQQMTDPPLSSIRLDLERQGYLAAKMLDDLLHGRRPPKKPLLVAPLGVATRVSTDILAIDEPDVRTALQFIREHAADPVTARDVLDAVPLSRRPLEKRFRRVLGRSILDEIHRTKVERAKTLMLDTKLSMAQIAAACGIGSAARFSIIFRSVTGATPTQFQAKTGFSMD